MKGDEFINFERESSVQPNDQAVSYTLLFFFFLFSQVYIKNSGAKRPFETFSVSTRGRNGD